MPQITIYTTKVCPYCVRAKMLLQQKKVQNIIEIDVSNNDALRAEMMQKAGGRKTVPQIFIGEKHIGGFDDMAALDREGKLDPLLEG